VLDRALEWLFAPPCVEEPPRLYAAPAGAGGRLLGMALSHNFPNRQMLLID